MKNAPKLATMELIFQDAARNGNRTLKPVPGFTGFFVMIHPKKLNWKIDGVTLESPGPITVITTSHGDRLRILKPWRCKKKGKEYGAAWVGLTDDTGKRKYFRPEQLAVDLFGDAWGEVLEEHTKLIAKSILAELF